MKNRRTARRGKPRRIGPNRPAARQTEITQTTDKCQATLRSYLLPLATIAMFRAPAENATAAGDGEVPEWSIGAVSKTVVRFCVPRVRIPLSPPLALAKAFSRSGRGGIFPLFSGVMREGLSTGVGAGRSESVLSAPIFSGPVNCAVLVNSS
jgi:hypothetical protein